MRRLGGFGRIISLRWALAYSRGGPYTSTPQDIAQQLFQQLAAYLTKNVISYPLLGIVVFVGLLWFFHEFREWRLSISVLTSIGLTLLFMLILTPLFSPFIRLFGF